MTDRWYVEPLACHCPQPEHVEPWRVAPIRTRSVHSTAHLRSENTSSHVPIRPRNRMQSVTSRISNGMEYCDK